MKITGVRTQLYEFPLTRPIGDANSPKGRDLMAGLAVHIDTDVGVSGIAIGGAGAAGQINQLVENLLVGRDPRGVRGLWKTMVDHVFKGGNRGAVTGAIAAIDIALWDLKARLNEEPLWKTLGASTSRVRAYASGIDMPLTDTDLRTFYESMAAKGICGGKLKVGLNLDNDLRRIGIMRDALAKSGKTPELMIDANEYWSPKQAIRYLHRIEEQFDIKWVEEPARRWDWQGLRKVSDSIRAAVASGENFDDISDFTPLIANRAVDILNLGGNASGITGALQIAALAHAFEVPVSIMNCPASFMAHLATALPNHCEMEVLEAGRSAVLTRTHPIEDGWIVLSDEPGLGFLFDEEQLREFSVNEPSSTSFASPWGRRRGAGMYLVGPDEPDVFEME